ncbi:MAG: aminopeptidase P family protein [Cytophagia bacterium]|nr:aminopeptidase P family protein [Cytophagia bacterium]
MNRSFKIFTILVALLSGFFVSQAQDKRDDYLSADFHQDRREQLRKLMPSNSVSVFFANPTRNRANDVDYVYHQDPNLYYLTGYREPHAVLLIFKDNQTDEDGESYNEIFFVQQKNPMAEMWTGRRMGDKGVQEQLKIENAYNGASFKDYNIDFSKFDKVMFNDFNNDVRDNPNDEADLYSLIEQFKQKVGYVTDNNALGQELPSRNIDIRQLNRYMSSLRGIKTPEEVELLRKAVFISTVGQVEVMKAMKPGMSETEIQGIHEYVFKKYGSEYEGYPSIVGAGNNGCILHYIENEKPHIESKEMILMDLGAEYHGYTADVTRTIPIDGEFSAEEKAIYDLVYKAQETAIQMCKPGVTFAELSKVAKDIINEGLAELGIIKSPSARHLYYPHGLSHHIGLDVHDLGTMGALAENMAITVEPGIYIPEGSDCDPKWWGIAVRIEDDVLITKNGFELLSSFAPRTTEEIEAMMKQPSPLDAFKLPELKGGK